MAPSVGIALAFVAMLSWGVADFTIQKATRKVGDWETLFIITLFGSIILLPFVYRELFSILIHPNSATLILISSGLVMTVASLLMFEGFRVGKLSVVEPLMSFEMVGASFLAFFVLGDRISLTQIVIIILLMIGLCMTSFREKRLTKNIFMEKGVFLFFSGALLMGFADFLLGWGARVSNPIIANFILSIVILLCSTLFLIAQGRFKHILTDIKINPGLLLSMSVTDNVAWLAYAFAMVTLPIAVATGLSESSIIVAVVLGFAVNREKLQRHQKIGLIIAIVSALTLAAITSS